jgi:predicted permease
MRDLRFAARNLLRTPIVSAIAILSLALGIGANAAIFSLFEQTVLRALPAPEPGQLVNFTANGPRSGSNSTGNPGGIEHIFSYGMFRDLERAQTSFTGIAAHRSFDANVAYKGQPARATGMSVSGSYFPVLGIHPALGRLFTPDDDRTPGAHRLAVLSHAYWSEKFNRDPGVLGQPILVNGTLLTIIGVAPAGFRGTTIDTMPDLFVPISLREEMTPGWKGLDNRRSYWIYLFARLKPGLALEQAQAATNAQFKAILMATDLPLQRGISEKNRKQFVEQKLTLLPGQQGQSNLIREARTPLLFLFAITGFVLLIACANIANLLLARSANRAKEFSIRLSLGATRGQVIRQLLAEALLLSLCAGVTALFVCYATTLGILAFLPPETARIISPELQPATLLFSLAVAVVAGFLFGLFPAVHSTRQDLAGSMKERAGNRFRKSLVTAQVALSLLLLVSAGLCVKSLVQVMRVSLGISTGNIVGFGLAPELNKYTPEQTRAFYARLEESLAAQPGVKGVAASMVALIAGNNWGSNVSVDGFAPGPDTDTHSMYNEIGPGYFKLLGIPLVAGREFQASDDINAPKVAVVNEAFVRKFSPGRPILGKRMQIGSGRANDIEIVGVAKDTKYSQVKDAVPPVFYIPYRQDKNFGATAFYIKSALPPDQVAAQVRRVAASLDANLPISDIRTLDEQVSQNIALDRMISSLAAAFAGLATLLAAVGLYGVLAFTVARRTREIGIRLAVGAQPATIRNMVLREVAWLVAIGVSLGVPAALALTRYAESLLFEVKGNDPGVFVFGVALVVVVSLLAGYMPARKAAAVDPMSALRYE